MKTKALRDELKQLTASQLEVKVEEFRRELLTLRLQGATSPVKSFASTKRRLRHAVACGLTLLHQKEQARD